jgi:hypothetical protein
MKEGWLPMPVRYDFEGNLFRVVVEGSYSTGEIMETFLEALEDPAFPEDARFLFDVRASSVLASRDPENIRAVAESFASHAKRVGGRCAILTGTPVRRGLGLMGATFADFTGATVEVFSDPDETVAQPRVETEK